MEAEDAIIYVKGGVEIEMCFFGFGVLVKEESAFTGAWISIVILGDVQELDELRLKLKGF